MTKKQPILDELHAVREQLLAESGGTLEGLVARLQAEQDASGRFIRPTRRTKDCTGAADCIAVPDDPSSPATR
jgi:hypothetical protein